MQGETVDGIPSRLDVSSLDELPPPPAGHRWLEFIGGPGWTCFLLPASLSRCEFLRDRGGELDPVLAPVYASHGIIVRQDTTFPLPGFYIVAVHDVVPSLDAMPLVTHLRIALIVRAVRQAQRSALGVQNIHLYYHETPLPTCSVHYWLMPVDTAEPRPSREYWNVQWVPKLPTILEIDRDRLLTSVTLAEARDRLLDAHERMREALATMGLGKQSDALGEMIEDWNEPGGASRHLTLSEDAGTAG
jgi:hypothetical protein